jgi:hypothetical protein
METANEHYIQQAAVCQIQVGRWLGLLQSQVGERKIRAMAAGKLAA